ncbi:MAG: hypothetical protein PHH06_04920 [Candidatus Gracilibacteria bacterium]|nr:hypothetical protein [Candidatus Gracilibacteria bacterium]
MKKYLFYIIITTTFLNTSVIHASQCSSEEEKQTDFCRIYYSNVIEVCQQQEYYKDLSTGEENQPIYNSPAYKTPEEYIEDPEFGTFWSQSEEIFPFDGVKRKYRDIQNNIYKCSILQAQNKAYKLIKELLKVDKTGALKNTTENQIESKLNLIKQQAQRENCNISKDLNRSKKQVLDQSTYEMCKYRYYLEFLKNYYNDIENIIGVSAEELSAGEKASAELNDSLGTNFFNDNIDVTYIVQKRDDIKQKIGTEIEHTYEVYKLAFNAYSEYESFLPIHIGLELLKQDYIILRDKLYQTLSPINQVVYKIINAMSK